MTTTDTTTTIRRMTAADFTFRRTIRNRDGRCVGDFMLVPAGTVVECEEGTFGLVAVYTVDGATYRASQILGLLLYARPC